MRYQSGRGGHAHGHLREAFLGSFDGENDALDIEFYDPIQQARWDSLTTRARMKGLSGQLWNCTDCLPAWYVAEIGLEGKRSYGAAVRVIRPEFN